MLFWVGGNVDIRIFYFTRWNFNLNIPTCFVVHVFWNFHNKFLDKGGHVVITHYCAFPFLDSEYFLWNLNLHILFHLYLAGQAGTML